MSYSTNKIRNLFIDYFVKQKHHHAPGSSLVPFNDPSLMFVNSGMVQFKNVFTGQEQSPYKRIVTTQKAVRAGGKHNDLDNVGYTARHHTFFEMLGNFSFGDYFKEEAIYYAWEFLTKELEIDKQKLYVTIYYTDNEAYQAWRKITGLSDDRIIKINSADNFWAAGDTGPCGPCSEIFYDHGQHIPGGLPGTKDQDGDRYVEIWNMVFMQYQQIDTNTRINLPNKSIDTGMGLERIAAVMQGVHDNYDIDIFREIISYAANLLLTSSNETTKSSLRVIADHLRSCAFLIADGVTPSNEGRGYVLRRIIRRAIRHVHLLGGKEPLMYRLLPKLIELMKDSYPELERAKYLITEILRSEEVRFNITLEKGLKLLDNELNNLKNNVLPGEVAFKLYDTYGFPLDLTQDIVKQHQTSVDVTNFEIHMQQQRDRAKAAWSGSGDNQTNAIWFSLKSEYGSTEFLGYTLNSIQGNVLALIKDNMLTSAINNIGEKFILISNQTPFYAESGGQLGDIGLITAITGAQAKVVDTQKYLGIHAHYCVLITGQINMQDIIKLEIDNTYRQQLRIHHSATHILHGVLRDLFGKSITQKGSLVASNRFRLDISYHKALNQQDIGTIEHKVNQIIADNSKVQTVLMLTSEAINLGAMALFGEKYDDEVRVVSMGPVVDAHRLYSVELCGGIHVERTGDIGMFKIISESAIAAGIRRIEAVCGQHALDFIQQHEQTMHSLTELLQSPMSELTEKVKSLIDRNKQYTKELVDLKIKNLELDKQQIADSIIKIGNINLLYQLVQDYDIKIIKSVAERISNKLSELIVVYVNNVDKKLSIIVAVNKSICHHIHAGDLAKDISLFLGGSGGGGHSTLAQAGGADVDKLPELPAKIQQWITNIITVNHG